MLPPWSPFAPPLVCLRSLEDPWDAKAYGRDVRAHEALSATCAGEPVGEPPASAAAASSPMILLALAAGVACGVALGRAAR